MPEFLGPPKPGVQYDQPIGAMGSGGSRLGVDSKAWRDFINRLSVSAYAGAPLFQAFLDVQGTGNNATNRYGNLDTKRTPLIGLRGELDINQYLSLILDAMKGSMDIVGQQGRHNNLNNIPYPVEVMGISPAIKGKYPTDYGTPYGYVGPNFIFTKQRTSDKGASPASLDLGLNIGAGYETPALLDKLKAFIEAKYLYNNSTGGDVEGQFAGPMQQMGLLGGLKYKFGEGEK